MSARPNSSPGSLPEARRADTQGERFYELVATGAVAFGRRKFAGHGELPSRRRPERLEQRDHAAVSDVTPLGTAGSSTRAVIAAGHELTRLSAALAFFRAQAIGNADTRQPGRVRV